MVKSLLECTFYEVPKFPEPVLLLVCQRLGELEACGTFHSNSWAARGGDLSEESSIAPGNGDVTTFISLGQPHVMGKFV